MVGKVADTYNLMTSGPGSEGMQVRGSALQGFVGKKKKEKKRKGQSS